MTPETIATDLTTATTTEAAKVRAELTAELAKLRAEVNSPSGHIILGAMLLVAGVFIGHAL